MQRRLVVLVSASLLALLSACAHTYGLDRQVRGGPLPTSAVLYVSLPESGSFGSRHYPESGVQTGEAVALAFASYVASVSVGSQVESEEAARSTADARGSSHLVVPTILHWEDRATEWSGMPDRIRVSLRVYEVASGTLLDAAEVSGKSRWGTLGGDHPQELLPAAVGGYVDALFGMSTSR